MTLVGYRILDALSEYGVTSLPVMDLILSIMDYGHPVAAEMWRELEHLERQSLVLMGEYHIDEGRPIIRIDRYA